MQVPKRVPPEALFLAARSAARGQRLSLFHAAADGPLRGLVVYLHPFAEEMNKSRRMAALQARALADAGYAVLQIDLFGCGDSSGDFGDASWSDWIDDAQLAVEWLQKRLPAGAAVPLWLWGLRAGCLLAVETARRLQQPCNFLFWAPSCSGKTVLQQFLRLKVASDLIGGNAKGVMDDLRQKLAASAQVDIAGYRLAPALAHGLEASELKPEPPGPSPQNTHGARVIWLELSTREGANLPPVAAQAVTLWQRAGFTVDSQVVNGPAFWQTTEIEDAPALVSATIAAMTSVTPRPLGSPGSPQQDGAT